MGKQKPGDADSAGALATSYHRVLTQLLKARVLVVLMAAAAFVGALMLMFNVVGQELFPPVDSGQLSIFVRMATGTRIELTEERTSEIEKEIVSLIGEPDPAFAIGGAKTEQKPDSNLQLLISNIGVRKPNRVTVRWAWSMFRHADVAVYSCPTPCIHIVM